MTHRQYRELMDCEHEALEAFAAAHGRKWRDELANVYWYNARIWRRDGSNPDMGHVLHRIRNDFGPQWLVRVYRPRATVKAEG